MFKINRNGNVMVDKIVSPYLGKNFFDMTGLKSGYLLSNGTIQSPSSSTITLVDGEYIYNATSAGTTVGFHNEKYIEVEANSKYTFSRDWAYSLSRNVRFYYYDATKTYIGASITGTTADAVIQLTTPANCKYMRMTCNNVSGYPFTIGETMVEEGHYNGTGFGAPPVATAYEPFDYNSLKIVKEIKCPNLYGTDYIVWGTIGIITKFGTPTSVEPSGTLTYPTNTFNYYYDTFTKTITQGTGSVFTVTNTSEETIDIYVATFSSFGVVPTKEQCDNMYKMFLFNGTGQELITLQEVFYVDYTGQVIHNLTSIYGTGNEPTLATHEALIPQYTNATLKVKAFSENLQQEYMQMSLDTLVYEGLSLRDIFENYTDGIILPNDVKTFEISGNDLVQRVKKHILLETEITTAQQMTNTAVIITEPAISDIKPQGEITIDNETLIHGWTEGPWTDQIDDIGNYSTTANNWISFVVPVGTTLTQAKEELAGTVIYYQLETPIVLHTFTTAPTQTQLDEWLDIYLTLTSNNTKTGTALVQDRFYVDYDNAKAYDYNIIEPYVAETPEDIQAFMEDVLDKTITLTSIPVKAKIYKDRFVILGKFIIVGE